MPKYWINSHTLDIMQTVGINGRHNIVVITLFLIIKIELENEMEKIMDLDWSFPIFLINIMKQGQRSNKFEIIIEIILKYSSKWK